MAGLIHGLHIAQIQRSDGEYCFADGPTFIGWVHQSNVTEPTGQEVAWFESWCQQMEQQEVKQRQRRKAGKAKQSNVSEVSAICH